MCVTIDLLITKGLLETAISVDEVFVNENCIPVSKNYFCLNLLLFISGPYGLFTCSQ